MTRHALSRARGLSLVELLLALALAALMLAPLAALLRNMAGASAQAASRQALARDANFALERIAQSVLSTPATILQAQGDTTDSGNWLNAHFKFEHGQLMQKGPDGVLADNVTAFSITAPYVETGQQLIQVSLTLASADATATVVMAMRLGGPR